MGEIYYPAAWESGQIGGLHWRVDFTGKAAAPGQEPRPRIDSFWVRKTDKLNSATMNQIYGDSTLTGRQRWYYEGYWPHLAITMNVNGHAVEPTHEIPVPNSPYGSGVLTIGGTKFTTEHLISTVGTYRYRYRVQLWREAPVIGAPLPGVTQTVTSVKPYHDAKYDMIYWSDQPPTAWGWPKTNYNAEEQQTTVPVDETAADTTATDTTSTVVTKRKFKNPVFNPPFNLLLSHQNSNGGNGLAVEGPDKLKRQLVKIVPAPFFGSSTPLEAITYDTGPWGFRALYNPTAWGYSAGLFEKTSMAMMATSDTDLLTPGSIEYTLDLMLNRTPDMALGARYTASVGTGSDYGKLGWINNTFYGGKAGIRKDSVGEVPLEQLFLRGTEYDVEHLFRLLNGDPQKIPVNMAPSPANRQTANRGILMPSRVRVYIGKAEFFEGLITAVDVNNLILTKDMVPMVSTLRISITRYPTITSPDMLGTTRGKSATPDAQGGGQKPSTTPPTAHRTPPRGMSN